MNGAYTLDPPPYFSLFPPVYYSHVTPRPYGFSPYAYTGYMQTPGAHSDAVDALRSAASAGLAPFVFAANGDGPHHQKSVRAPGKRAAGTFDGWPPGAADGCAGPRAGS